LNTKKICSDLNNLNTFTKEIGCNKVKLPKVGFNAIVHVPVRAGPKNIDMWSQGSKLPARSRT
jgi:hypothetical protein